MHGMANRRRQNEIKKLLVSGYSCTDTRCYEEAIKNFNDALTLIDKQTNKRTIKHHETEALLALGTVYKLRNDTESAIECQKKALVQAQNQRNKKQECDALFALGTS